MADADPVSEEGGRATTEHLTFSRAASRPQPPDFHRHGGIIFDSCSSRFPLPTDGTSHQVFLKQQEKNKSSHPSLAPAFALTLHLLAPSSCPPKLLTCLLVALGPAF